MVASALVSAASQRYEDSELFPRPTAMTRDFDAVYSLVRKIHGLVERHFPARNRTWSHSIDLRSKRSEP